MRFGPLTLMKNSTFDTLVNTQTFLTEENSRLSAELGAGITTHSFMHYPWTATSQPQLILAPDEDEDRVDRAIKRVAGAYSKMKNKYEQPGESMWNDIAARHKTFIQALEDGDQATLKTILPRLFQSDVIWGLGKFDQVLVDDMKRVPDKSHVQLRIADALVSLAQAAGTVAVTSVEQQGIERHLNALKVDLGDVVEKLAAGHGIDPSSPRVGASYGCEIDSKFVTLDSILHSYTIHRFKQLGASQDSSIAEIGGGFGCLAELAFRHGLKRFTIYDLPWVNCIQGYYLIKSMPEESVSLYGEPPASINVRPYWLFEELPDRSLDFVLNCDSIPEMSSQVASGYISQIERVLKGVFLSINQEAKAPNALGALQNSIPELIDAHGGFRRLSRSLYWMRQGYVEETYALS